MAPRNERAAGPVRKKSIRSDGWLDSTPSATLAPPCCSRRGANAVQVQRWLGHHSAAFTLARYVHLLDGDLGEPLAIPQADHSAEPTGEAPEKALSSAGR